MIAGDDRKNRKGRGKAMTNVTHGMRTEMGTEAGWPGEAGAIPATLLGGSMAEGATGNHPQAHDRAEPTQCAVHGCLGEGRYGFHGQRACSRQCLELLLRSAVIEEQTRSTAAALKARPRVQLGRILIEQGTINEAQLDQALRSQRATGAGRLGCWLKQQVELPETEFTAALSIQWRCPVFRIGTFTPARMASYLPRPLVEQQGALPLRLTGSPQRLSLCFEDHVDYELMSAAERMHGVGVDAGLLTATEFWAATRELLSVPFPRVETVEASSPDCMTEAIGRFLVEAHAQEARMVAVHGCYWLRIWTASRSPLLSPVPYDILCTPVSASPGPQAAENSDEVEALTGKMLRVLY